MTHYVEYIKGQPLYRILVPSAHILLSFCIRIGAFDRSRVFGLVLVFRVPCILVIGVRVQRANVDHCGRRQPLLRSTGKCYGVGEHLQRQWYWYRYPKAGNNQ